MKTGINARGPVVASCALALVVICTIVFAPALVEAIERLTGRGGSIDFVLRIYFGYGSGLILLSLVYWSLVRSPSDLRVRVILGALIAHFLILLSIWAFDRTEFTREISAIRFFSAGALFAAAAIAAVNVRASVSVENSHRLAAFFWLLVSLAFLTAAIDDYFNVHETIATSVEPALGSVGLPRELVQDGITAAYAFGALVFLIIFRRCFRCEMMGPGQISGWLLIVGVALYSLAVANDSLDKWVGSVVHPGNPEFAMNFFEEILEFTAAVLFAASFVIVLLERHPQQIQCIFGSRTPKPLVARLAAVTVPVLGVGALLVPAYLFLFGDSDNLAVRQSGEFDVSVFADVGDGLDQIDEIVYWQGLGLIVGNEGTGQLLLFDDAGKGRVLVDGLESPDGIALSSAGVIVADEVDGSVHEFSPQGDLLASFGDWESPEGVAVNSAGIVFIADSHKRLVASVSGQSRQIVASALDGLVSPEQLASDDEGNLYVADEAARKVFRRDEFGHVRVFADSSDGIRTPEGLVFFDGRIYVADAHGSRVLQFELDGTGSVLIDFERKKDLAGIAFGSDGALYVAVTSEYRPYNQILRIARP